MALLREQRDSAFPFAWPNQNKNIHRYSLYFCSEPSSVYEVWNLPSRPLGPSCVGSDEFHVKWGQQQEIPFGMGRKTPKWNLVGYQRMYVPEFVGCQEVFDEVHIGILVDPNKSPPAKSCWVSASGMEQTWKQARWHSLPSDLWSGHLDFSHYHHFSCMLIWDLLVVLASERFLPHHPSSSAFSNPG